MFLIKWYPGVYYRYKKEQPMTEACNLYLALDPQKPPFTYLCLTHKKTCYVDAVKQAVGSTVLPSRGCEKAVYEAIFKKYAGECS